MFELSQQSISALNADKQNQFVHTTCAKLRELYPSYCDALGSDDDLISLVHRAIDFSETFGIRMQRAVFKLSCLALLTNEEFQKSQAVQSVLTDDSIDPNDRVDGLYYAVKRKLRGDF